MVTVQTRLLENVYTSAEWAASNPILPNRVKGGDSTVLKYKIGDGVTAWNDLEYWNDFNKLKVDLPIGTQLTDIGGGVYAYRVANSFGDTYGTSVRANGVKIFVNDKATNDYVDFPLPDIDDTGKTTAVYSINVIWVDLDSQGGGSSPIFNKLATPTLSVSNVKQTSFTLNWNDVGADIYYIFESTANTRPSTPSYKVTSNTLNIINKVSQTTYYFWIIAKGFALLNSDVASISVTTTEKNDVHIVTLGTSITYGEGDVNGVSVNPNTQSWPAQLVTSLGSNYVLDNYGVSGATMAQIQSVQLPKALASYNTANYVSNVAIIEGGTNDFRVGSSAQSIYDTKKAIAKSLETKGYKVILLSSPPFNNSINAKANDPIFVEDIRQQLLNLERAGWLSDMTAEGYVDISADPVYGIYVGPGKQNLTYFQPDGVHFTPAGYNGIAQLVKPAIAPVVAGNTYGSVSTLQDATLSALSTDAGSLRPAFISGNLTYNVSVASGVTSANITATASKPETTLKINSDDVTSGVAKSVSLVPGANPFVIHGRNSNSMKTYLLNINRLLPPGVNLDFNNSSINVQGDQTSGGWSSDTANGFAVSLNYATSDCYVQFQRASTDNDSCPVGLDNNSVLNYYINGSTYQWSYQAFTFNGSVYAIYGNNVVNAGAAQIGYYRINRASSVVTLQFSTDGSEFMAIFTYPVGSNENLYAKIAFSVPNKYLVGVKAYGFNVVTVPDATLSAITISPGVLSPAFVRTRLSYYGLLPAGTTSIQVTPTINAAVQTIQVNGMANASGTPSSAINISDGTIVDVIGTSADGTYSRDYKIQTVLSTAPYLDYSRNNINIIKAAGTGNWQAPSGNSYAVTLGIMAGNGYIQYQRTGVDNDNIAFGLDDNGNLTNYLVNSVFQWKYQMFVNAGNISVVNGITGTAVTAGAAQIGYYRINRTGSTVTLQYSADLSSWSVVYTYTATFSGNLYAKTAIPLNSKTLLNATQSGFNF